MTPRTIQLSATMLALGCAAATSPAQQYRLIDLGGAPGAVLPQGLSNSGFVAGWSMQADSSYRAVRWQDGAEVLAGAPGATLSVGMAANELGSMYVMLYTLGDPVVRTARYDTSLPVVLGDFSPRAVNAAGGVVGRTLVNTTAGLRVQRACVYQGGTLTSLITLGGQSSEAFDINSAGWIVGSSYTAMDRLSRPTLWTSAGILDLGTLSASVAAIGQARAINDAGVIVGWTTGPTGAPRATLFRTGPTGVVTARTDLGTLTPGASSFANDVNNAGQVVGTSNARAFVWSAGTMTDLNALVTAGGWKLEVATAINDRGWIAGTGTLDGAPRGFLLVPSCGPADIATAGSSDPLAGPDGFLTGEDFDVFIIAFFKELRWPADNSLIADLTDGTGAGGPDGFVTGTDFDFFIIRFFQGC